jgi:two-component system, chemotaxis family, CheB/CheR fusion protein
MTRSLAGKRIVLIDDDVDVLHTLRRALEKSGAEVTVASTTETALRNIAMTKPSIVVTDISMPDGSGYDLIKRLRTDQATARTPVIALTGHTRVADIEAAAAAGFAAHVAKPTRALKLIRAIEETFARMFREPIAALRARTRIATYR